MPVQYPDSTVVKETLPLRVVQAYSRELRGRTLPALGSRCAAMFGGIIGAQVIGQQIQMSRQLMLSNFFAVCLVSMSTFPCLITIVI